MLYDKEPPAIAKEEVDAEAEASAEYVIAELKKLRRNSIVELDEWLHRGISAGKFTEATALEIREQRLKKGRSRAEEYAEHEFADGEVDIPEWEPHKSGQHTDRAPPLRLQHAIIQRQNGAAPTDNKIPGVPVPSTSLRRCRRSAVGRTLPLDLGPRMTGHMGMFEVKGQI